MRFLRGEKSHVLACVDVSLFKTGLVCVDLAVGVNPSGRAKVTVTAVMNSGSAQSVLRVCRYKQEVFVMVVLSWESADECALQRSALWSRFPATHSLTWLKNGVER